MIVICTIILVLIIKFIPRNMTARNNSANSVSNGTTYTSIPGLSDSAFVISTVRPTDVENAEEYNSIIDTCFVFKGQPYEQKYEGIVCRIEYIFNYERFEEHMLENNVFREGEPYPIEDFDGLSMIYFPAGSVSGLEPDTVVVFRLEMLFAEEDPTLEDSSKKTYYNQP